MEILAKMWSVLGFWSALLPPPISGFLHSICNSVEDLVTPYAAVEIPEFSGYCGIDDVNDLYQQVYLYLNSINAGGGCHRLAVARSKSSSRISYSVAPDHAVYDCFSGHRLRWTHQVETAPDSAQEKRSFVLKLPARRRSALLSPYIDHVTARAKEFELASRERRLFTNNRRGSYDSRWSSVPFRHPSTFDNLAIEPDLKSQLVDDLTEFGDGKEFYRKIGRAWKRGYLLHGPPGSGKSSLIAAMANHLRYDVYDLELSKVAGNSELRALLIQTTNRSIIVVEDIDCSIDLTGDRSMKPPEIKPPSVAPPAAKYCRFEDTAEEQGRVTVSGLLSFTDGLWSCCGEERVMVFTTNQYDVVEPSLARSGRMDVHVSLGTCGAHAFRALVKNYLGVDSHVLFDAAERYLRSGGALTPAQVADILLRNRRDADAAVRAVVAAMQAKMLNGGKVDAAEGG